MNTCGRVAEGTEARREKIFAWGQRRANEKTMVADDVVRTARAQRGGAK